MLREAGVARQDVSTQSGLPGEASWSRVVVLCLERVVLQTRTGQDVQVLKE